MSKNKVTQRAEADATPIDQETISDSDFVFNGHIKSVPLSNLGLIAGTYDAIGIEDIIESC